jgi:hypothetical protein
VKAYLDMSPVLASLHECPHEFTACDGWVQQRSCRYRFKVQANGHVLVETEDGSVSPLVACAQGLHLFCAIETWRANYWIPREVNRIFARQIRPRGLWQRKLDWLKSWLPERTGESALATYAWAFAGNGTLGPSTGPPPRHPTRPRSPAPRGEIAGSLGKRDMAIS